jgi:hypothetical protein
MRRFAALVLAGALLAVGATTVTANGRPLEATLTGAAENPPADPDGFGSAQLRLNHGQGRICYTLTVGSIDPATAAHIHAAPVGVNGGVVVPLVAPTTGSSSACASVSRDLVKAIMQNPENYYVNVHNATYPGGAIRGQLSK